MVGGVNHRCVFVGAEQERQWMVCEGFQMILKMQADALVTLGVGSHFRVSIRIQVPGFSTGMRSWSRSGSVRVCFFFISLISFFLGPGVVSDVETLPAQESPSVHSHTHQDPISVSGKPLFPCLLIGSSPQSYLLKLMICICTRRRTRCLANELSMKLSSTE